MNMKCGNKHKKEYTSHDPSTALLLPLRNSTPLSDKTTIKLETRKQ